jgi:hypothetical protein
MVVMALGWVAWASVADTLTATIEGPLQVLGDAAVADTLTATIEGPLQVLGDAAVAVNAAAVPTARGAQVSVSLSSAAAVSVSICNIAGREIAALPPADLPAGVSTLLWNGLSANGTKAPPGRYLVRVTARSAGGAQANALTTLMLGQ